MDLEKEERRRDRKVKRMKVKMFVDYPSHLTWSTLGVLSAWSFETRILTMLSKNIKLIFKKIVLDIAPNGEFWGCHLLTNFWVVYCV